jgi:L-fucose isomerase-like protein
MIEFILIASGVGLAGLIVYRIFFVHETVAQVESDIMTGLKGAEAKVEEVEKKIEAEVVEVVEEVKVATKKLKAKTKAIEEAAEAKVQKIEAALKKAKGNG